MNYRYANHDEVAELVRNGKAGKDYAVVDVRDDDYRGGNMCVLLIPLSMLVDRFCPQSRGNPST